MIAAVLTPVDASLQPDTARACAYYSQLLDRGCDGVNVLGTTGEAMSLSVEQRLTLMRSLATRGLPLRRMMVGTGSASLADTAALTVAAIDQGFGGVLVMPPFFYRGSSADGMLRFFEQIAKSANIGPGQLYLYNFPAMSGTRLFPISCTALVRSSRLPGSKTARTTLPIAPSFMCDFPP